MLAKLIESGFGNEEDYNCAEKILYGSNQVYDLGISSKSLKMCAAFGGGMAIEDKCGVITAGLMVLGLLFTETVAHQSEALKPIALEFMNKYETSMGSIDCGPLKNNHRDDQSGCYKVILEGAKVLDEVIASHKF